jgi:hypothetical protein
MSPFISAAVTIYVFASCAFFMRYQYFYRTAIHGEEKLLRLSPIDEGHKDQSNVFPIGYAQWLRHFSIGIVNMIILVVIGIILLIF